jgi:hypothetical protein
MPSAPGILKSGDRDVERLRPRALERLPCRVHGSDLVTLLLEHDAQELGHAGFVVDDENLFACHGGLAFLGPGLGCVRERFRALELQGERGAGAGRARDGELSAQSFHDPRGDRQAEAGAARLVVKNGSVTRAQVLAGIPGRCP